MAMDSRDSSPRSDAAADNHHHASSFEDPPPPKVKLMCSYGGRIQPRPHDNHLTYVAGDTKILSVDRHVKFPALLAKLSALANAPSLLKYQLPGEDLDALISVTSDDDLHHMMLEYDRLPRPARLRLFLFPLHPSPAAADSKSDRQWFVDALNSVQLPLPGASSSPPPPPPNPDFLFGLDNPAPEDAPPKENSAPESSQEHRQAVRETLTEPQPNMQVGNNSGDQRKINNEDNGNGRAYAVGVGVDSFNQKNAESNATPLVAAQVVRPGTVPFLPSSGNQIYLIQTPSGMFQAVRPVTGPVGQPVYFVHAPGSAGYGALEAGVAAERGYSPAGRGGARW
ncbi:hypothetical protein Fmac_031459 [Flemingia macrophylla]|uniref:PB1 domain-containing protein n=1 Tax=Flemingia macrophylla TaxID=520843 RepID=A0ABD1L2J4_9FABA